MQLFCRNSLSFNYSGMTSYLFVNGVEIYKFKAKDSDINAAPLFLGNDNLKKTRLNEYAYGFTVIYDSIYVAAVLR